MPPIRGFGSSAPAMSATRRFRCTFEGCEAAFVKRAHLRRHEMTHTQRRDFSCPGCGRAFSRNDSMTRHLRRKHPHLYQPQATSNMQLPDIPSANTDVQVYASSSSAPPYAVAPHMQLHRPLSRDSEADLAHHRFGMQELGPHACPSGCSGSPDRHSTEAEVGTPHSFSSAKGQQSNSSMGRGTPSFASEPSLQSSPFHLQRMQLDPALKNMDMSQLASRQPLSSESGPSRAIPAPWTVHQSSSSTFSSPWPARFSAPDAETKSAEISSMSYGAVQYKAEQSFAGQDIRSSSLVRSVASQHYGSLDANREEPCLQPVASDSNTFHGLNYSHVDSQPMPFPTPATYFVNAPPSHPALSPSLPPQQIATVTTWEYTDPLPSTSYPPEYLQIESGLDSASANITYPDAPAGSLEAANERAAAAADSYFQVDVANFSERDRLGLFHDSGNVASLLADFGLDPSSSISDNQAGVSGQNRGLVGASEEAISSLPVPLHRTGSIPGDSAHGFAERQYAWSIAQNHPQEPVQSPHLPSSLPSSQAEYLGPNATSHRRIIDRISSAQAIPSSSQDYGHLQRTISFPSEAQSSMPDPQTPGRPTKESPVVAEEEVNFTPPHDSFRLTSTARDEEGCTNAEEHQSCDHASEDALNKTERQISVACTAMLTDRHHGSRVKNRMKITPDGMPLSKSVACQTTCDGETLSQFSPKSTSADRSVSFDQDYNSSKSSAPTASTTHGDDLSRRDQNSYVATLREDEEHSVVSAQAQKPPQTTVRRRSVASISTDQAHEALQRIIARPQVFAKLCQGHLHPSAETLTRLSVLIPQVTKYDVPIFHPKVVFSQKIHTAEEALALLAVTSLRSDDQQLVAEGRRLACFLFGMVMLSFKLILYMGENRATFLKCFLLVGMRAMRQPSPELWNRFDEIRDSILLDVTDKASEGIDPTMDNLDPEAVRGLKDEALFKLWTKWYAHESRKRTVLLSAIVDSQSACYFAPLDPPLTFKTKGPRCQFLFAHVYEPCPDTLFHSWPPESWARKVSDSSSLPSARAAEVAFDQGEPLRIAAIVSDQLLKPHIARPGIHRPRFRKSFDLASPEVVPPFAESSFMHVAKDCRSSGGRTDAGCGMYGRGLGLHVDVSASTSVNSSRRQSSNDDLPPVRTISQLQIYGLLEAINGAWMADSAWYRPSSWGRDSLGEYLQLDRVDCDESELSISDLPGWRAGRTLTPCQIAHGLMNWSEMLSKITTSRDKMSTCPIRSGLKIGEDMHCLTIRWQSIFLGLCAPLPSLCYFLNDKGKDANKDGLRRRRIEFLLKEWSKTSYARRALVHASTILCLFQIQRKSTNLEGLGPPIAHALYSALTVLVSVTMLLRKQSAPATSSSVGVGRQEELVSIRNFWGMVEADIEESCLEGRDTVGTSNHKEARSGADWSYAQYWHEKYELIGLAGILTFPGNHSEEYLDWRPSLLPGLDWCPPPLQPKHLRQRNSSFVGEAAWPMARRETIDGSMTTSQRRFSHVDRTVIRPLRGEDQESVPTSCAWTRNQSQDLLTSPFRSGQVALTSASSVSHTATEKRRWILHGSTQAATFCGLSLVPKRSTASMGAGSSRAYPLEGQQETKQLNRNHLRRLLDSVRDAKPMWCYSQDFLHLLTGALDDAVFDP